MKKIIPLNKTFLYFLAVLILIVLAVTFFVLKKPAEEYFLDVQVDEQTRQELETRIAQNLEIFKEFPKDYNALLDMGNIEATLGNASQAIDYFKKAWEAIPTNATPWLNIGNIYIRLGMYREAEQAFLKAKDVNRGYYFVYFNLAKLYKDYLTEKSDKVRTVYLEGLKNTDNDPQLLYFFSTYLGETGNYSEAIEYMKAFMDKTVDPSDIQNALKKIEEWESQLK
jgi:tetratricopeptide (TPR) repeat protein